MNEIFAIHHKGRLVTKELWAKLCKANTWSIASLSHKFYPKYSTALGTISRAQLPPIQKENLTIEKYIPEKDVPTDILILQEENKRYREGFRLLYEMAIDYKTPWVNEVLRHNPKFAILFEEEIEKRTL